ncbi:(6-4)dna photolyase [Phtheirospermum japonicum]|uniref:(6-4)dna photolyase n=1 Tax=Phtheirospermum japonicum TaxID=374723 RepID=A0A830C6M1_9LAMI|nr:(6-4)dna photolyase [Phtheirospermum japonicum]
MPKTIMRLPVFPLSSSHLNPTMAAGRNSLVWFRKGLRLHDNPAIEYAAMGSDFMYPLFVIDPHYMEPDPNAFSPGSKRAGLNRIGFLLESLVDLDLSLRKLGSRLLVLKGEPSEVLFRCLKEWSIKKLCFEFDTDPYYQALDDKVKKYADAAGIEIFSPVSHTIFNPADIIQKNGGRPPLTYQSFVKLAGEPTWASSPISTELSSLPSVGNVGSCPISEVPSIKELGYEDIQEEWVASFEKPKGDPSSFLIPATTVLSPYLKVRYFYQCIQEVERNCKNHTSPPVSLLGQLLWRDFFYTVAFGTPNFDQMKDNRICKQIPWKNDDELLAAWRDSRTGFPWIDAIMMQYNRIYSPISFGKKYDPDGNYIRHFLPILKDMPKEYIYEPWAAPLSVQVKAKCIIGKDYPKPVIAHDVASKDCRQMLYEAYDLNKRLNGKVSEDELKSLRRKLDEDKGSQSKPKKLKQTLIG